MSVQELRGAVGALALLLALAGCSFGTSSTHAPVVRAPAPNHAPRAQAGVDRVARAGETVTLSGVASTDPEGDALRYAWTIAAGGGGGLTRSDRVRARFMASVPGTYVVELAVHDAGGLTSSDVVVIEVQGVGT